MRKHHNKFHFYRKQSVIKHLWDSALPLKHKSRDEILEIAVRYLRAKHAETKKKGENSSTFPCKRQHFVSRELVPVGRVAGSFVLLC